jgi:hypothetical protein
MASYRVLEWHGIPSQVQASDESGPPVSRQLPDEFQREIDRVAMARGLSDSDAYLEGWAWSTVLEREGPADEVADAVAAELAAAWQSRKEHA